MAASLKTLSIMEERDIVAHISGLGNKLRSGIDQIASNYGVDISQSGPSQMPMVLFKDDKDFKKYWDKDIQSLNQRKRIRVSF